MRNTNHRIVGNIMALALVASLGLGCSKAKDEAKNDTPKTEKAPAPVTTPTTQAGGSDVATPPAVGGNSLAAAAGKFTIDPGHSSVIFRISHFGFSNVYGRFNKTEGTMNLDGDPAKSSVELQIDAASIFTANQKRDGHLKSPDFFNVQQFPTITFKSTSVKDAGDKKYEVTGDLAMHGVTKSVTATLEHIGAGVSPADNKTFMTGFEGELTIKRSDFGMNYMEGVLGDDIRVIIAVEASRD